MMLMCFQLGGALTTQLSSNFEQFDSWMQRKAQGWFKLSSRPRAPFSLFKHERILIQLLPASQTRSGLTDSRRSQVGADCGTYSRSLTEWKEGRVKAQSVALWTFDQTAIVSLATQEGVWSFDSSTKKKTCMWGWSWRGVLKYRDNIESVYKQLLLQSWVSHLTPAAVSPAQVTQGPQWRLLWDQCDPMDPSVLVLQRIYSVQVWERKESRAGKTQKPGKHQWHNSKQTSSSLYYRLLQSVQTTISCSIY